MKTAEEFLRDNNFYHKTNMITFEECMIEFAKMHVEEALKQESENFKVNFFQHDLNETRKGILTAYPLNQIK